MQIDGGSGGVANPARASRPRQISVSCPLFSQAGGGPRRWPGGPYLVNDTAMLQ
jgi:hypothetical protein